MLIHLGLAVRPLDLEHTGSEFESDKRYSWRQEEYLAIIPAVPHRQKLGSVTSIVEAMPKEKTCIGFSSGIIQAGRIKPVCACI